MFWPCTFIPALVWDRSDKGCQIWDATISPWHHGKEQQESGKHQSSSSVTAQLHLTGAKATAWQCPASGQALPLGYLSSSHQPVCGSGQELPCQSLGDSMHQEPLPSLVWMKSPFFSGKIRFRQGTGSCEEAELWGAELRREADEAVNVALLLC